MERFSGHDPVETFSEKGKESSRPNIERVTGWLVGLQPAERTARSKARQETLETKASEDSKTERYFERRKEILRDDTKALQQKGMVAVGEVLADKTSDQPHLIGASGIQRASKQKRMATEEKHISTRRSSNLAQPHSLTPVQAIQVGVAIGVGVGLLILLWLSVR